MALATCLNHGRLRQYSAQYGGWLPIKLVLFHHALVVDPDGDAPSAIITPRKRRNSLKMWMDLCLVADVVDVRKTPENPGLQQQQGTKHRYGFTVTTTNQMFVFDTERENEREEWVRGVQLAMQMCKVNGGSPSVPDGHEFMDHDVFFRFASSDSEDSDSDNEEDEAKHPPASEEKATVMRSAQLLSKSRHSPIGSPGKSKAVSLTLLHITATAANGTSISVSIPLSEASRSEVTVHQIKLDAIQQLRNQLYNSKDIPSSSGFFYDLLRRDADHFALCHQERDRWLKNEQQYIGAYVNDIPSRNIHLAIFPVNAMPFPTIEVEITDIKHKISDLSQRTYTAYIVSVAFNDMKWHIERRFKEFYKLHGHLRQKYPRVPLPHLPPKHVFTPLEGEFINRRREQLENYLKQTMLHPLLGNDVLLLSFLGIVSTSRDPELSNNNKNVLHITTLYQSLDCGDIILFSCRFGASVLQRTFTGAKYDHVGIVVPGESRNLLRIMEATSEGIQVYSLKPRLMAYSREVSNTIIVRKITATRTTELVERLREFVSRVEGNPYSILGILQARGESQRVVHGLVEDKQRPGNRDHSLVTLSASSSDDSDSSSSSCSSTTPSITSSRSNVASDDESRTKKRKYFCSSLAAATLKHIGWLDTKRTSSSFWPGSFEDHGEIEQYLAPGITMEPETVIDCRIIEVGLAKHEDKPLV